MAVNILSNALLRGLNGTGQIRTWTKPFDFVSYDSDDTDLKYPVFLCRLMRLKVSTVAFPQQISDHTSYTLVFIEAIILGMLAAGMPAYFAMDHTRDREVITFLRS